MLWPVRRERWYRRYGAVLQELVPVERELRLVVAGGRVAGGAEGEPVEATRLALAAAAATETDVVATAGSVVVRLNRPSGAVLVQAETRAMAAAIAAMQRRRRIIDQ